jgi:hypothetical protein
LFDARDERSMSMLEESRIEEAVRTKEVATAALYRPDGTPRFADAEHKERERAVERQFRATMDRIEAGIEERFERASRELEALEHGDPAAGLSTDELQRAAAMSGFMGADAEKVSVQVLSQRARTAVASGDRAALYALQHHAARRVDDDLTGEVREAVAELRRALDPDAESRLAAARAALEAADDLRLKAQLVRAGATNLGDAFFGARSPAGGAPSSSWTGAAS